MGCIKCGRGLCSECGQCSCCNGTQPEELESFEKELKDPLSTGRKRAAVLYPLDPNGPCEWQQKKNCGGGRFPIVGCLSGKQTNRHHGPDKSTTNNERGNIHLICATCHQRWHWLNDYIPPHNPQPATGTDIAQNEINWARPGYAKSVAGGTKLDKKVTSD